MTALATRTLKNLDHNLGQHLEQLGFISLASYLLWCRKNGFAATATKSDDAQRNALYGLLKQVERRADLFGLKTGSHHWPRDDGNNYEDALAQLAGHHQQWLRPVDESHGHLNSADFSIDEGEQWMQREGLVHG